MSNGLMMHAGGMRVTKEELALVSTPEATATHKPVPHIAVAELVTTEARNRGYEIASEEYGLSNDKSKMFGVLRFGIKDKPDTTRALGFRNSHDKSLALGLTVGLRVLVCDNLAFGGETTVHRKHTSGIDIQSLIPGAFDKVAYQFTRLEETIDGLKIQTITIDEARVITVMAAEINAIPSCDILNVLDTFKNPPHEEFRASTRWNLHNAFTEVGKKYSPTRAFQFNRGVAKLFNLE